MKAFIWKLVSIALVLALILALGAAAGAWLAACHYRPLVDKANTFVATAKLARDDLEALAAEQSRKLGEMVVAGDERSRQAALALEAAKELAKSHYAAAHRLLQERSDGEPASVASMIIDQELGI